MNRILFITVVLIVYGSLYPWQFRPLHLDAATVSTFLHSWPARLNAGDLGDIVVNLLLYMPVGMFGFLALERHGDQRLRWVLPVLLGLLVSCSMETLQIFDRTRVCSLLDVLDNTIGAVVGTVLGFVFRRSLSGAMLLVLYWIGYQLCVLFGVLAGTHGSLRFLHSPLEAITLIFAWGLLVRLITARNRKEEPGWHTELLAAAFTVLLLVRGLAPFHFQAHAARFSWIPFASMFASDWIVGLPVFLEKSFYYGLAIWLWRGAGMNYGKATALVAVLLAAIEVTQRYLPGRTAEITDPLLAVLLGLILWTLEQDYEPGNRFETIRVST